MNGNEAPRSEFGELGPLDGLQEFFWATEPSNSRLALCAAEVRGTTSPEDWERGAAALRDCYPMLSAVVIKSPGKHPIFVAASDDAFKLEISTDASIPLEAHIERELDRSFGIGNECLARLVVVHHAEHSIVIFVGHHAAFDGRTNVSIIQDLLAVASGETLDCRYPILPTKNELLGLPLPEHNYRISRSEFSTDRSHIHVKRPARTVQRTVKALDLSRMVKQAREERTTFHAMLVTAALFTGRDIDPGWRDRPVVCLSPMDLRPLLGLGDVPGVLTTIHPTILQVSDEHSFWDFARGIGESMKKSFTLEYARNGARAVAEFSALEVDPWNVSTVDPQGFFDHDLMISNYGDCGVRTRYRDLELVSLFPAHISGGRADTQTLSAITVNGTLHLNQSSREPMMDLLDKLCERLLGA